MALPIRYAILMPSRPQTFWEGSHEEAAWRFLTCCQEEPKAPIFLVDVIGGLVIGHQLPPREEPLCST